MESFSQQSELQEALKAARREGKTIAFVPTMGNLHEGHLSLMHQAKQHADICVASIFVNPLQFGPNEDFDAYPRTLQQDQEKLQSERVDFLYLPTIDDIYPRGMDKHTQVKAIDQLTNKLCGASRPNHFLGVTTIVNILFNIVQPDIAIFGKKDFQQLQVIKRMVDDLCMPIDIIGGKIVREKNGLAMSSRNGYLSDLEKDQASHLRATIIATQKQIEAGDRDYSSLIRDAQKHLKQDGFKVDYFEIVNRATLEPAKEQDRELLIAAAAWLGQPRLIDNQEVDI
ncbi:pantoate--beta-alanine ligase [Pleionea litopenaei]|uniref:Pantothenate synthetase n=1 Tax=Pleionea litopenaei TaxID=3070815 RepID=A0AA51RX35_9GAMM|nr:pantoate--beta-alanine ligase [Pleionea sp. HL-JVS1]WMS89172.1 pantoate--beta-alanine ligase [Pleionea sp. HL-JVS1]